MAATAPGRHTEERRARTADKVRVVPALVAGVAQLDVGFAKHGVDHPLDGVFVAGPDDACMSSRKRVGRKEGRFKKNTPTGALLD